MVHSQLSLLRCTDEYNRQHPAGLSRSFPSLLHLSTPTLPPLRPSTLPPLCPLPSHVPGLSPLRIFSRRCLSDWKRWCSWSPTIFRSCFTSGKVPVKRRARVTRLGSSTCGPVTDEGSPGVTWARHVTTRSGTGRAGLDHTGWAVASSAEQQPEIPSNTGVGKLSASIHSLNCDRRS